MALSRVGVWVVVLGALATAVPFDNSLGSGRVMTVELRRSAADHQLSSRALRTGRSRGQAILNATGSTFLAPIKVGSQTFYSVVDSGSSDTWVIPSNFSCADVVTGQIKPPGQCFFGQTYTPDSDFRVIANQNFNITYGDGEYLHGRYGNATITLADITVSQQQIALPTKAAWYGDGITSGVIGLAYPALTAAYPGSDGTDDRYCYVGTPASQCNQIEYSPLLNNIFFRDRLTLPVFALALSRDASSVGHGGYLSIGGVPSTTIPRVNSSRTWVSTPVRMLPTDSKFRYYIVRVDGLVFGAPSNSLPGANHTNPAIVIGSAGKQYILDSGTTLNFFSSYQAALYNSKFQPPAVKDRFSGFYVVSCNSTPPLIGIKIGGAVFYHNPTDLIKSFSPGQCISGIQDRGSLGVNILGDVFLDNVLALFDLRSNVVRFSARPYYQS